MALKVSWISSPINDHNVHKVAMLLLHTREHGSVASAGFSSEYIAIYCCFQVHHHY